ncbi:cytotoxic T-lymphocyte protein 4 [Microcaecilia unicolor]|uniref:Cytotoxic T-lymphocyte protein 4 n=1 Tax=Microcaecilia unicolor TaxID=1415580 RepID=A0A6P7YSL3_9AMPH|nr:cytotoxic T-lymphocyte protein 4 [Microcaecilia unicolor]
MLTLLFTMGFLFASAGVSEAMEVIQPPVTVANRQGNASLVCGYKFTGKVTEIRVTLLKRTGDKSSVMCASSYTTQYEPFTTKNIIQCHGVPGPNNVTLTLIGLHTSDTGRYTCRLEIMYPPPYRTSVGNETLIYVSEPEPCTEPILVPTVLVAVITGLSVYSILMTIIILINKIQSKNWLTTGIYMKMPLTDLDRARKVDLYEILKN